MRTPRPHNGVNHTNYREITGRFFPAGTGTVTTGDGKVGWSVTRAGVGTFTITLTDIPGGPLVDFSATVQSASAAALAPQFGAYSSTAGTITLRLVNDSAAATDMSASSNSSVSFRLGFASSIEDF